jgi:hypothetical protein
MGSRPAPGLPPAATIATFVGDNRIYNPRQPYDTMGISLDSADTCDSFTGNYFAVTGPLQVICHRATATPAGMELLALAGHTVEANLLVYRDREEYRDILAGAGRGQIIYQHAHPPGEAPEQSYAVPRRTLVRLTNKALLHEVVDAAHLPRRRLLPTAELARGLGDEPFPVVIKAACEESLGGGDGVRICRSPAEVRRAAVDFAAVPDVVVEEHLAITENWCVNVGVGLDGSVHHLGAAEQIVSNSGVHLGNRIAAIPPPDVVAVAHAVAQRARDLSYRGIAGIDIARTRDGRTLAIDLNFRLNACTPALLLRDSLAEWSGRRGAVSTGFRVTLDDLALRDVVRDFVNRRVFVPTGSFLPGSGMRKVAGIVLAYSWAEATQTLAALSRAGLISPSGAGAPAGVAAVPRRRQDRAPSSAEVPHGRAGRIC